MSAKDARTPERWLPIPDYEGFYEVSDLGRVRSVNRRVQRSDGQHRHFRGRMLKQSIQCRTGYPVVSLLTPQRGQKRIQVHRLVLLAFVGPLPEGHHSRHLNGSKTDNRLENLRYGTPVENSDDKRRHGTFGWTPARWAAHKPKTHCPRGHPRTPDNVSRYQCKICRRVECRGAKPPKPPRLCVIDGCGRPHASRGWCRVHYKRWWRSSDSATRSAVPGR